MPFRRTSVPQPEAGEYSIDTGTAVLKPERGNPGGWLLTIDGMQSSHIDLNDPFRLEFEYMRWMAGLIEDRWPECSTRVRVLHLAVLVRRWFGLPQAPLLKIRVGEAREVTTELTAGSRDVVVRDVFLAGSPCRTCSRRSSPPRLSGC